MNTIIKITTFIFSLIYVKKVVSCLQHMVDTNLFDACKHACSVVWITFSVVFDFWGWRNSWICTQYWWLDAHFPFNRNPLKTDFPPFFVDWDLCYLL